MEGEKKISYYANFKKKHAANINEKIICDLCKGSYSYFNKSGHKKTKKHLMFLI